jgi:hypothetical protein
VPLLYLICTRPMDDTGAPETSVLTSLSAFRQLREFYKTSDTDVLIMMAVADYGSSDRRNTLPPHVISALRFFDSDNDGSLNSGELEVLGRIASEKEPCRLAAMRALQQHYGLAGASDLGFRIASDYNSPARRSTLPPHVVAAMRVYDSDGSETLDAAELSSFAGENLAPLRKLAAMRLLQRHYGLELAGSAELCSRIAADYNNPATRALLPRDVLAAVQAFDVDSSESIEFSELFKFAVDNLPPAPGVVCMKVRSTCPLAAVVCMKVRSTCPLRRGWYA